MKTVGIAADNYKVEKFLKELKDKGHIDVEVSIYKDGISLLKIRVPDNKVKEIHTICQKVEMHFKQSN